MKVFFKLNDFDMESFKRTLAQGDQRHLSSSDDGQCYVDSSIPAVEEVSPNTIVWRDSWFPISEMSAEIREDRVVITTALSAYTYVVYNTGTVMYDGPIKGFLQQNLLPEIILSYAPTGAEDIESSMGVMTLRRYITLRGDVKIKLRANTWHEVI